MEKCSTREGKRKMDKGKNWEKTDKSGNDAERDRPRRRERIRYTIERGEKEKEKARGGSKMVESEELRCKGGKRGGEGGYSSIPLQVRVTRLRYRNTHPRNVTAKPV